MYPCRLCGGSSTYVADYDLRRLGGFWAEADCEHTVQIRRCAHFGSYFTATIPRKDLLIGQYLVDHGAYYDDPLRNPDIRAERCASLALPFLRAGATVLDVGGGNGAFALVAARKGFRAWLQEHGEVPVGNLSSAGVTVVADLAEVPTASIDAVTLWDVYEHVWPHDEFLKPLRRILRPGGRIFVEIPSPSNLVPLFVALSRILPSPRRERALAQICNYTHLQLMTSNELQHSLLSHGFEVQHIERFSELSYRGVAYAERLIPWRTAAQVVGAIFDNPLFRRVLLGRNKTFAVVSVGDGNAA